MRNRTIPLSKLDSAQRVAIHQAYEKRWRLEGQIDELRAATMRGDRRARRRYLHLVRTHLKKGEWDQWSEEERKRFAFYRRFHTHRRQMGAITNLTRTPSVSVSGGGESVVAGAYYVDKVNGNDANDGLLVAEGGDGAMQTIDEALARWAAASFNLAAASDDIVIYVRDTGDGNYPLEAVRDLDTNTTTELARKVRLRGYVGERPTIDGATPGDYANLRDVSGDGPIHLASANIVIEYIGWFNDVQMLTSRDVSTPGCELRGLIQTSSGDATATDNAGILKLENGGNGILVEDCVFNGSDGGHANCACVYLEVFSAGVFRRNILRHNGGSRGVVYFKHASNGDPGTGNITWDDCVFHKTDGGTVWWGAMNRNEVTNCLYASDGGQVTGYSSQDNDGYAVGHGNLWDHCTFYRSVATGEPWFWIDDPHNGVLAGTANSITNCLFDNVFINLDESDTGYNHGTTLDWNMYQSTGTLGRYMSSNSSDLASWVTALGTSQDSNSIEEDASYATTVDISTPDYTTLAVDSGSSAFQGGSDGEDIGCSDVTILGPQ